MRFNRLRRAIEKLARVHIYRALPRGIDVAYDIAQAFPAYRIDTVFDVGANVGQSATHYVDCFPHSRIYCFEPVRATFCQLRDNVRRHDRVHCSPVALGAARGKRQMALEGRSGRFFLLNPSQDSPGGGGLATEEVEMVTLDDFCGGHTIERVNYLKIDTEGADLEVLKGAASMLNDHRIDFVEVEAGMNADNTRHVPFERLKQHLELRGYLLFGIYAQMHEWPTNEPHLRRTNSVFVSRVLIDQHKKRTSVASETTSRFNSPGTVDVA